MTTYMTSSSCSNLLNTYYDLDAVLSTLHAVFILLLTTILWSVQFSHSVVSDSVTPGTAACQASLSFTVSQSLLKLMSLESMTPSNHLILCLPLLLLPSVFLRIRVFLISQFFASGGQSIGASAPVLLLPNSQAYVPDAQWGPSIWNIRVWNREGFITDSYKEKGGSCPKNPNVTQSFQQGLLKAKGEGWMWLVLADFSVSESCSWS